MFLAVSLWFQLSYIYSDIVYKTDYYNYCSLTLCLNAKCVVGITFSSKSPTYFYSFILTIKIENTIQNLREYSLWNNTESKYRFIK
jgi:hypothetical protein